MKPTHAIALGIALLAGCGQASSEAAPTRAATTGAKTIIDEFGRYVEVDEECGGTDLPEYPDHFQNAMFRDGDIAGGRLWMVDGSHLWSAPAPVTPDSDVRADIELPFVGVANAVAAGETFVAVATLDQGVRIFPGYDFSKGAHLGDEIRTLDLDLSADGAMLAVAAGADGLFVYDMTDPGNPFVIDRYRPQGFAVGVRWGAADDAGVLYWAACSQGGYVDYGAHGGPRIDFAEFGHPNVKDAHGDGQKMVVANNGGGVEFLGLASMRREGGYDVEDPLFYANAVYVAGPFAFVAAGNREMLALLMSDFQPATALRRDPISILVDNGVVYGFGNFREVGDRTVVRAPQIRDLAESDDFEEGFASWTEPRAHGLRFADASREYLARRAPGGYEVYQAAFTETSWTRLEGYRFFALSGSYAVSVTADGWVKASAPGMTEPAKLGQWYAPFPSDGHAEVFDGGVVVYLGRNKSRREYKWDPDFDSQPEPGPPATLCDFPGDEAAEGSGTFNYFGLDRVGVTVRWCSRLVDPYVPVFRPAGDAGTRVRVYADETTAGVMLGVSGVVKVTAPEPGRIRTLIDDRIAYTTSLVAWDISDPSEPREVSRYVRFGRPADWLRIDADRVRVWLTDGAMFTYDFTDGSVTDVLPPVDGGAP